MSGLTKPKKLDISETNIAGLGTELEKKVRLDAAQTEAAWKGVGQKVELRVWRIENFKVVPWPEKDYGKFYSGDSFIVLNTWKKPDAPMLYHDIHFWLGLETTQDEAGTAAYKTVELDDFLGTLPIQHREVQTAESTLFLSYFKHFHVEEGGVASGFKHVGPTEYRTRLIQIKQNKKGPRGGGIVAREVPLSFKSLNSGDVFVLDCGLIIYQWNGGAASGIEKAKSAEFVSALDSSRDGLAKVVVFDEGDKDAKDFWTALGGEGPVASAADGDKTTPVTGVKQLWKLSDATGKMAFSKVSEGVIKRADMSSDDVSIVDGISEIFVFIGSKASAEERKKGMQYGLDYLKTTGRPMTTAVSRLVEGGSEDLLGKYLDH